VLCCVRRLALLIPCPPSSLGVVAAGRSNDAPIRNDVVSVRVFLHCTSSVSRSSIHVHYCDQPGLAMSLNDLPAELTALVVSYLILLESPDHDVSTDSPRVKPPIAKYACASMGLQTAVEAHLFRHILLEVDDLRDFVQLVAVSPQRLALLRSITFIPTLPDPIEHECSGDSFCQQANDKAFDVAMQSLYNVLRFCAKDIGSEQPLRLTIGPSRDQALLLSISSTFRNTLVCDSAAEHV
jgi:hypothetical protein